MPLFLHGMHHTYFKTPYIPWSGIQGFMTLQQVPAALTDFLWCDAKQVWRPRPRVASQALCSAPCSLFCITIPVVHALIVLQAASHSPVFVVLFAYFVLFCNLFNICCHINCPAITMLTLFCGLHQPRPRLPRVSTFMLPGQCGWQFGRLHAT